MDVEEPGFCVHNSVLDDPFNVDDVEVARKHGGFFGQIVFVAVDHAALNCPEAELFGLDALGGHIIAVVDAERYLEVETGSHRCLIFPEAGNHRVFCLVNNKKTGASQYQGENDQYDEQHNRWRQPFGHLCVRFSVSSFHRTSVYDSF